MKWILLVDVNGYWKQLYASFGDNGYDKCLNEAMKLDDMNEWMVVRVYRWHSGIEKDTIHG